MGNNLKKRRVLTRALAVVPIDLRSKIKLAARLRNIGSFEEETHIGARPFFSGPTDHWLSPLLPLSYSRVWQPHGVSGMNYISVALKSSNNGSELLPIFDPLSPYYQAWFGVYVLFSKSGPVGFRDGRPVPEELMALVVADQDEWQRKITGSILPGTKFVAESKPEEITLPKLAEKVSLFYGAITSYSVLIPPDEQSPEGQRYFRLPEKHLWSALVEPRHPLTLGGFGSAWWDKPSGATFFAYGVGADFVDKNGQRHDYTGIVEPEVLRLLGSLSVRRLRS